MVTGLIGQIGVLVQDVMMLQTQFYLNRKESDFVTIQLQLMADSTALEMIMKNRNVIVKFVVSMATGQTGPNGQTVLLFVVKDINIVSEYVIIQNRNTEGKIV